MSKIPRLGSFLMQLAAKRLTGIPESLPRDKKVSSLNPFDRTK